MEEEAARAGIFVRVRRITRGGNLPVTGTVGARGVAQDELPVAVTRDFVPARFWERGAANAVKVVSGISRWLAAKKETAS